MPNFLKTLKIAKHVEEAVSPLQAARDNMLRNLKQQHECAVAFLAGETFTVTAKENQEDEDGNTVSVEVQKSVRTWFWTDAADNVRILLRHANKRLEIEKGQTDIVVGDKKDLPNVIDTLIKATIGGELDKILQTAVDERAKAKAAKNS